jgi:replicative DNA helicase
VDLDKIFVASVLKGGRESIRLAQEKGVGESLLQGEGLTAWKFVIDYLKTYDAVPDPGMVHGKTNVKLDDPPPAPPLFFIDEILNRQLHGEIGKHLKEIIKHFEARDPKEAYAEYEKGLRELRKLKLGASKTVSLPSLAPDFLEYYERLKNGMTGILTPWPTVNDATLGFWPEDFVLYVARLGVGKTWTLILLANYAWHVCKKRVLFATTEMSQIKILQRWVAVHFKLTYNDLRRGRLDAFAEQKMKDGLEAIRDAEGLDIIGGDFDFRIESLEAAIEESEPDIVFVDGAYLLKVSGDGRTEKAANSFDELKRTAKRNQIPLVSSTQFNREVKSNKLNSAAAEKIALSDAAGWNADLIFGLVQTEDMKKDRRLIQKPLKFREGAGEDVECWWDFEMMNFDELSGGPSAPTGPVIPGGGSSGGGGGGGSAPAKSADDDPFNTGLFDFGDDDDDDDGGTKDDFPF